jgi:hypothetical protein
MRGVVPHLVVAPVKTTAMPGTCSGKVGGAGNEPRSSARGECCSNVHIGGRSHNLRRCARDPAYACCSRTWLVSRASSRSSIAFSLSKTSRWNLSSIGRCPKRIRARWLPAWWTFSDCGYPAFAFNPAASMPAMAQASSLSEVSPLIPTAPSRTPPSWISTPPGTGTIRPCASVFTAATK